MVQLTVKGLDKVTAKLKADAEAFIEKVKIGMYQGMWQFSGKFTNEFLKLPGAPSKRITKALIKKFGSRSASLALSAMHPSVGLYNRTGTLVRSIMVRGTPFVNGYTVFFTIGENSQFHAPYAIYHDKSCTRAPNIPKRIDLYGQFKIQGIPQIHKAIELKLGGKTKLTGGR